MGFEDMGVRCDIRRASRFELAGASPAVLKGYRLLRNIMSAYRNGGIFNIVPDQRDEVHGAAYELHAGEEISVKSAKEGASRDCAMPEIEVRTSRGEALLAKSYGPVQWAGPAASPPLI